MSKKFTDTQLNTLIDDISNNTVIHIKGQDGTAYVGKDHLIVFENQEALDKMVSLLIHFNHCTLEEINTCTFPKTSFLEAIDIARKNNAAGITVITLIRATNIPV